MHRMKINGRFTVERYEYGYRLLETLKTEHEKSKTGKVTKTTYYTTLPNVLTAIVNRSGSKKVKNLLTKIEETKKEILDAIVRIEKAGGLTPKKKKVKKHVSE